MSHPHNITEYAVVTAKLSPSLTVAAATFAGASLQDWVLAATLVYTLLQTALLIRKTWRENRANKETNE